VFRGFDPELRREVAIKQLIPQQGETASTLERRLQRFQLEGRAAAKLAHPLIVGALEVGSDGGRPFLVMEFVEGQDLETLLGREDPSLRRRVELLRDVAEALGHAHQNGIVHRDVKPGNVMVDQAGRARLTDFGLARDVEAGGGLSRTGQIMGTPLFLSPEQAAGQPDLTKPATDVFAFGGVAYMVLTGQPPFPGENMMELLGMITSSEPVPPSKLNRLINRDLETIVLKCLEKDQPRRYQDAGEVARELEHFLAGEAIEARPLSGWERLLRLAGRNKLVTLLCLVFSISIVVGGLYSVYAIKLERDRAQQERAKALQAQADAEAARSESDRARAVAEAARADAEGERQEAARAAAREAEARGRAEQESRAKDLLLTQALAEKGDRLLIERRHTHAAALYAASLGLNESVQARSGLAYALQFARHERWTGGRSALTGLALLDDQRLVVATQRGRIYCYTREGVQQQDFTGHRGRVSCIDSAAGVVVAGLAKGKLALWGAEAPGKPTLIEGHEEEVTALAWSLDGKELATVGADRVLKRWGPSGQPIATHPLSFVPLAVGWSPDRAWLAVAGAGGLAVIRLRDGALVSAEDSGLIAGLGFGPQGLWTGDLSGRLSLWSIEGARAQPALRRGRTEEVEFAISALAISPRGSVAVASPEGRILCLELAGGESPYLTRVGSRRFSALRWLDEDTLAAGDASGLVGLQSVKTRRELKTLTPGSAFVDLVLAPSGATQTAFFAAGEDGKVWIGTAGTQGQVTQRSMSKRSLTSLAISADARLLAGASHDLQIIVNYLHENRYVVLEGVGKRLPQQLAFGAGYELAAAVDDEILLWKLPELVPTRRIKAPGKILSMARARDGRVGVTVSGLALLYDSEGNELSRLPLTTELPRAIAFEPGTRRIAVGSGRAILLWEPGSKGRPTVLRGHRDQVHTLSFGPSGRNLVSGGRDTWVCIWNLKTSSLETVLEGHTGIVTGVAVDPRGRFLMSAGEDGVLRVWELNSPHSCKVLELDGWSLGLLSDGRIVSSGGKEGLVKALDPRDGTLRPLIDAKEQVRYVATGPRGLLALAMSRTPDIAVFDLTTRKALFRVRHEGQVTSLCITPSDPPRLFAASHTKVRVWDVSTGELERSWVLDPVDKTATGLCASPDGNWVAFGMSQRVRLFSVGGLTGPSFDLPQGHGSFGVSFSPDSQLLGVASQGVRGRMDRSNAGNSSGLAARQIQLEGEARIIDLRSGATSVLRNHQGFSFTTSFSPDGRFMAEGGGGVVLWDVKTKKRWVELVPPTDEAGRTSMLFGAKGNLLISRGAKELSLAWLLKPLAVYDTPQEAADRVWGFARQRVVGMDAVRVDRKADYLVRRRLQEVRAPR
jgi:eukaryotic-like serine/threonine-protein kinase